MGGESLSRKVKKKRKSRAQERSHEPRLAGFGPLLPVAGVLTVIVLSICGLEWLRGQVLSNPKYNPEPKIQLEYLPGSEWVQQEGWLPRIQASIRLPDKPYMDDKLPEEVAQQVAATGWVRRVLQVERGMDGTIRVCCDYRRPIAMVLTNRGKYIPVDKDGVRLPEEYERVEADSGWMRILGVQTEPPPVGGSYEKFRGEKCDGAHAVRLAFLLFSQPETGDKITGIDVSNCSDIMLYTRDGGKFRWGSAIGCEVEEPEPAYKLRNLALTLRTSSPQACADLTVYRNGVLVHSGP